MFAKSKSSTGTKFCSLGSFKFCTSSRKPKDYETVSYEKTMTDKVEQQAPSAEKAVKFVANAQFITMTRPSHPITPQRSQPLKKQEAKAQLIHRELFLPTPQLQSTKIEQSVFDWSNAEDLADNKVSSTLIAQPSLTYECEPGLSQISEESSLDDSTLAYSSFAITSTMPSSRN